MAEEQSEQFAELQKELNEKSEQIKELNKSKAEIERLKREKEELKESIEANAQKELNEKLPFITPNIPILQQLQTRPHHLPF